MMNNVKILFNPFSGNQQNEIGALKNIEPPLRGYWGWGKACRNKIVYVQIWSMTCRTINV